jgi:hypothetical protein
MHGRRIRVTIYGDHLNTQTLKLNDDFFAELA